MTVGNLETLRDFADASFDAVVVTLMLCKSTNLDRDMRQLHRILVDGGHLYFLEHEPLSDDAPTSARSSFNPLTIIATFFADSFKLEPYSIAATVRKHNFLSCEVLQNLLLPQYYPDRRFVLGFAIK